MGNYLLRPSVVDVSLYFSMFSLVIEMHTTGHLKITITIYYFTILYFPEYNMFRKITFQKYNSVKILLFLNNFLENYGY